MPEEPTTDPNLSPDGRYRWDGSVWIPVEPTPQASANPYVTPAPYGSAPYGSAPYGSAPYGTPAGGSPYGTDTSDGVGNPYAQTPHNQTPLHQNPYGQTPYGHQDANLQRPTGGAPGLGWGWMVALSPLLTLAFLVPLGWFAGPLAGDAELPDRQAGILGAVMVLGWLVGALLSLVGALVDRERLARAGIRVPLAWSILGLVVWPVGSLGHLIARTARSGRGAAGIATWTGLVGSLVVAFFVLMSISGSSSSGFDSASLEKHLAQELAEDADADLSPDDVDVECPDRGVYDLDETVVCEVTARWSEPVRARVDFLTTGTYRWEIQQGEQSSSES